MNDLREIEFRRERLKGMKAMVDWLASRGDSQAIGRRVRIFHGLFNDHRQSDIARELGISRQRVSTLVDIMRKEVAEMLAILGLGG